MKRRYVDTSVFESRNLEKKGNADYRYWFDKTNEERLHAAGVMTSVAFNEPDFFTKKVDRTIFSARKHYNQMSIFNPDFIDFIDFLNKYKVRYILVGGYAVILRGYSRSTGYMDIWVNKTPENFHLIQLALKVFGLPVSAIPQSKFFSEHFDVFSFGRPPYAIEILTSLKGMSSFGEAYKL